jgi:hypothetical protein
MKLTCGHGEAPKGAAAISSLRSLGRRDCFVAALLAVTRGMWRVSLPCFFTASRRSLRLAVGVHVGAFGDACENAKVRP